MEIPIEVSARHIHLTSDDYIKLFGEEKLEKLKDLSQPNQFAAKQTITIIGPKNKIENVRIIGPHRDQTQLEISITDSYFLGINPPPILLSGNLEKSAGGLVLKSSISELKLDKGIIIAKRHLHISPNQAQDLGLKHLQNIKIKIDGKRSLIFDEVTVRSRENKDELSFQIDTDEANAAGVKSGDYGNTL